MRPGISEGEAKLEAAKVFRELSFDRLWHPSEPFGAFYEDLLAR